GAACRGDGYLALSSPPLESAATAQVHIKSAGTIALDDYFARAYVYIADPLPIDDLQLFRLVQDGDIFVSLILKNGFYSFKNTLTHTLQHSTERLYGAA